MTGNLLVPVGKLPVSPGSGSYRRILTLRRVLVGACFSLDYRLLDGRWLDTLPFQIPQMTGRLSKCGRGRDLLSICYIWAHVLYATFHLLTFIRTSVKPRQVEGTRH